MKIVSKQECQDWLKANLGTDFGGMNSEFTRNLQNPFPYRVSYPTPRHIGKLQALAHQFVEFMGTSETGLLWFTSWPLYSEEEMALFQGYRKSLGESRQLIDSPGHIFDKSELQSVECLLDMALFFLWSASLFDGAGNIVVRLSQDEFIDIYAKDEERLEAVKKELAPFGLG